MKRTPLKRKTRLTSKAKPKPRKRIKAKPRGSIEFQRIYGSKRRVAFVSTLPCVACQRVPCENAHIVSGGMGRKADYTDIVPLCPSCHRLQHQRGWTALSLNALTLKEWALWTQWKWATRPAE